MEPRPAATVVVARSAEGGVEVLAVTRARGTEFAPGFVVFPGGAIDPADEPLAARLFADPAEAARACALRELYEEAGILLTAAGPVARSPDVPLSALQFDPPIPETLVEIGRWLAPEDVPRRFDARFFATGAPAGLEAAADGTEIERAAWVRPEALLAAAERGDASLAWPTTVTLRALAGCETVSEVLSLRVEQLPRPSSVPPPR